MMTLNNNCNCKFDWDYRCGCFPPSLPAAEEYCKQFRRELFWCKKPDVVDNWGNCPVRICKSVQFVKDTLCNQTHQEKAGLFQFMGLSDKDIKEAKELLLEEECGDLECDGDSYFECGSEMCSTCHYPHSREYERQSRILGEHPHYSPMYCGGGRWKLG